MIDDIIKDFKASLYERTASPLFVTFIASWVVWNYKLLIVILSGAELDAKLAKLSESIPPDLYQQIFQFAVGPLIAAFAYLLLYPIPSRWIYRYWQSQQKKLKETRQQIEDETPLTREEARQIRMQMRKLEALYRTDIDERDRQIQDLRRELADSQRQLADTAPRIGPLSNPENLDDATERLSSVPIVGKSVLGDRRARMLNLLREDEDVGKTSYEDDLVAASGLARSEALLALDELRQSKFARQYDDGNTLYRLLPDGREAAIALRNSTP